MASCQTLLSEIMCQQMYDEGNIKIMITGIILGVALYKYSNLEQDIKVQYLAGGYVSHLSGGIKSSMIKINYLNTGFLVPF